MNVVFLSPNFPHQFFLFCTALAARGVHVFGVGDSPPGDLRPELRGALAEYVYLPRLDDYEMVHRAIAGIIARNGRIDRIDSHNEHWLALEAQLREDFNIPGQRPQQAAFHRSKAGMAEVYAAAKIPHPAPTRINSGDELRAFAKRVGLPLVLKPEVGVGSAETFKVSNQAELDAACARELKHYVAQPFVTGIITSFDGLVDRAGKIIFSTSHIYSGGVMEVVNEKLDVYFYSRRVIPPKLEELGRRTVAAFDIRERFFHAEFFELPNGEFVALEVNLRPPGGFTLDMMNYACDTDLYAIWADMLSGADLSAFSFERRYHCAHVGRRSEYRYVLAHDEAVRELGPALTVYRELPFPISIAMGDGVYIVRHEDERALLELIHRVQARRAIT